MLRRTIAIAAASVLAACGGGGEGDKGEPAAVSTDAPAPPVDPSRAIVMCTSCHSVTPHENRLGPSLFGVFGRKAGSEPGFFYSEAMKNSGRTWDETSLDAYLTNPRMDLPGNKMTFAGMGDAARRKAVIDYLKTLK